MIERELFDSKFVSFSLSDMLLKSNSANQVKNLLKTFSCQKNLDLKDFLHNKAILFERSLRSRTYLFIDSQTKKVAAYYTVAISTLFTDGLTKENIRNLDGYNDSAKSIPCFLIGQLGKSDEYSDLKIGGFLLADALATIKEAQEKLGGRFVLIDAVNNQKVIDFYKKNSFLPVEMQSENDQESLQMFKPYYT